MTLVPGSRIGPYDIAGAIGAGGMGQVYRARDSKLGRDVAIKVLPAEFALDVERVARFRREAQILASLNHPGIAAIHGLEEGDGRLALAMEYVDGEDLAQRLERGAIAVEESIAIARQVAAALEEAHERGVVHRDLKPANVKVTSSGKVKVLDFGLAKAVEGDAGAASGQSPLSHSPTMSHQGTVAGMILGTAAYMSPEQARGKPVDKRADIWSFGVLLFEMLSGKRLFGGETVSDVLAAVLRADVDWKLLPPIPSELRRLIGRCLERDPRNRLHDIADARIVIDELMSGGARDERTPVEPVRARPGIRELAAWTLAAVALAAAAVLGVRGASVRPPQARPPIVFGVLVPEQRFLTRVQSPLLGLSADGRTLLFVAEGKEPASIFRRSLDRMTIARIEGTEGADHPMPSPDGRWIAFFAGGMLRKIPADGGASVALAEALAHRGASWAPDGSIVFAPLYTSGLLRVAATGGTPVPLTRLDPAKGERSHRWPQVLPDGRSVIFTVGASVSPGDYDGSDIDAVRLDTGERKTILKGARMARYSALGYLVYQRGQTLLAARFDPGRLEVVGDPFTIQEGVGGDGSSGSGYFGVSDTGVVSVVPEASIPKSRVLVLADGAGRETALNLPPAPFNHPRFSPDGRRLTFAIGGGSAGDDDVYVVDLASNGMQRLTFGQGHGMPLWSLDGRSIMYTKGRTGDTGVAKRAADGSGEEATLLKATEFFLPDAWHPDGRRVALTNAQRSIDVSILDTADNELTPLFTSPTAGESAAAFSPDGRYIAYTSTETGTDEVIVESYPPGSGKWQVSTAGGMTPVWSRDGRALYFVGGQSLMVVDVDLRGAFRPSPPRALFTGPYELRTVIQRNFDVGPDGRFVLVKRQLSAAAPSELLVLDGWTALDPLRGAAR